MTSHTPSKPHDLITGIIKRIDAIPEEKIVSLQNYLDLPESERKELFTKAGEEAQKEQNALLKKSEESSQPWEEPQLSKEVLARMNESFPSFGEWRPENPLCKFIAQELLTTKTKLLKRVEKEVIGEDEESTSEAQDAMNDLRYKQRAKLTTIRKEL